MADYQFGFDHTQKQPTVASKGYNQNTYGAYQNKIMIGYITSVTDQDILDSRFTVKLEGIQSEIRATVMYPIGYTHSNGIGIKPFAPEVGTPVCIQCFEESRQAVILGTLNLPGLAYGSSIVDGREVPEPDEFPMWRPPYTNNLMDLGIDSSVVITPVKWRTKSDYYETRVPTGIYLPGNIEVQGTTGINYTLATSTDIRYAPNTIIKTQGVLKDYSEKALESLKRQQEEAETLEDKFIKRAFSFLDGKIYPDVELEGVSTLAAKYLKQSSIGSFLAELDRYVGVALKIVNIAEQFIAWANQDISFILEDLLQTFGQFDLDLGLVNIDLSLSLTSIDLNLDFRIGTGIPQLDSVINTVLSTTINTLLDNLLKEVKIGELLGLDLSGLLGTNTINTNQTYIQNTYTPALRSIKSSPSNISSLISSVKGLLKLDEESIYQIPSLYFKDNNAKSLTSIEILGRFITIVTRQPFLYEVPKYLDNLYRYKSEQDIIACLMFATSTLKYQDRLRCTFLFSYYCFNNKDLINSFLEIFYTPKQINKLITVYNIGQKNSYERLSELVSGEVYNPLSLDLNLFKDTLENGNTKLALEYLISGNYTEFINMLSIIHSKYDIRFNIDKYTKLKLYINKAYTNIKIGYE